MGERERSIHLCVAGDPFSPACGNRRAFNLTYDLSDVTCRRCVHTVDLNTGVRLTNPNRDEEE